MLKAARVIIVVHLLLASWWLYSLLTFKEGWEMGESFGLAMDIGMFIYNIPLLIASFMVQKKWPTRIVFWLSLMPWIIIIVFIIMGFFIHW